MAFIFSPGVLRDMFGSQYNMIQTIPIDVTVKETHSFDQEITDKPVEDGATISDNIILKPDVITIQGIFTDQSTTEAVLDYIDGQGPGLTSWEEKLAKLHEIRKAREPFTIVTSLGSYANMFFSGPINVDRDATTAGALFFSTTLKGINIIQSRTTQVPADATQEPLKQAPAKDKGKISNNAGAAAGVNTSGSASNEKSASWLSGLTGYGA